MAARRSRVRPPTCSVPSRAAATRPTPPSPSRRPATNFNYIGAESDTEGVGEVAAGLTEEFYDGGGNIRLVGHSLGSRCVYWTAIKLSAGYQIETVAAIDSDLADAINSGSCDDDTGDDDDGRGWF